MVLQIIWFAMFVVIRCNRFKAKRDDNNNANELDMPPIVPHGLVKVVPWHFISDMLNVYRPHLEGFWSKEEIDKIKAKQHDLIKRYNNN